MIATRIIVMACLLICQWNIAEARWDIIPGSRYTSGRAAAMGDAYLPLGDDPASGLFYNPANIARIRKPISEPINFSISGNGDLLSAGGTNSYKVINLPAFQSTLDDYQGMMPGAAAAFVPSFAGPGIAFGILVQADLASEANLNGTYTYRSLYQFIPALGFGHRFFDGMIRIGYSLQWVNQASGEPTIDSLQNSAYNQYLSQGSALSHNFGLALTAPLKFTPSINLVARNVLGAHFVSYTPISIVPNAGTFPSTEAMTIDGSFSLNPRLLSAVTLHLVGEGRDLLNASGVDWMGHLALGAEISVREKVFLRGGWRGGYPSGGFGMRRPGAEMSLTWYTEEIGKGYLSQGESHFLLQYQFRTF